MTALARWIDGWGQAWRTFLRANAPFLVVGLVLTAFAMVFFFDRVVVSVHSGQAGVLWRRLGGGTVLDSVYGEGLHLLLPINKMYVYNLRKQQFNDSIDALTVDGLTIKVQYSVRYFLAPETLPSLHQTIGPDYVGVVIRPEIRSVVRTIFGQYKPEDIYTSQKLIQERVSELSKIRLQSRFIDLDDVPIESISLPARISDAIETKMAYQQTDAGYTFQLSIARKEAERKRIEADGLAVYNATLARSLSPQVLHWQGIQATQDLAKSPNAKTVVIGAEHGLPLILGRE
ncbi:prohibitin family protein [Phaeospirillum tilakii]|uniref:Prohibitin family protein n=1 Tax=Phaeospirillum tilakii TaxID=741673 RepID=A0ABW5CCV6_9PROT